MKNILRLVTDQFSTASLIVLAKMLPTTIFSQLTVRVALRVVSPNFRVTSTKCLAAVVLPANRRVRLVSSPSWSVVVTGTWAKLAVLKIRDFKLVSSARELPT